MKITKTEGLSKALTVAVKDLGSKQLKVGFFDNAKYEDGTPVAYVATIQELGHPQGNIPPRPFMRPTVEANSAQWQKTLAGGAKRVTAGKMTVDQMLGQFGMMVAGEVAATIASVTSPPLKPSTIRARQSRRASPGVSTKPLVDTGLMIQSVSSKVENV